MTDAPLSLAQRLWFALACFLRVLFDGAFAARVRRLTAESPAKEPSPPTTSLAGSPETAAPAGHEPGPSTQRSAPPPEPSAPKAEGPEAALLLLAIFQREGRLVDFLEQDVESFPDADVGAAARVVHAGCRRALRTHFDLARVRDEAEGTTVIVSAGDAARVSLTGNVRGSAPYQGVLRHAGWRVERARLPELVPGHDATIVCAAEVEL